MVWVNGQHISMLRGWVVLYKDGTIICEDQMRWAKLPGHKNIERMFLKWEDRMWSIDHKEHYIAPKIRGYIDVNTGGGSQGIQARKIGYYDMEDRCKVYMCVDEATGTMTYETEPF